MRQSIMTIKSVIVQVPDGSMNPEPMFKEFTIVT
jgi:hypothetical protein